MVLQKKVPKKVISTYVKNLTKYEGKDAIKLMYDIRNKHDAFNLKKLIELTALNYVFYKQTQGNLENVDVEVQFCGLRPSWEDYIFDFLEYYGYITIDVITKVIGQNIE